MAKLSFGIQLTESSARTLTQLQRPEVWRAYKMSVLQKVTEGAKAAIQSRASTLWRNPTGQLDSSWFTTYDFSTMRGSISNSKKYAYWLNYGVRPHVMSYLLNGETRTYMAWGKYPYQARAPIPLPKGGGIDFRRVTVEAIQAGKWRHPGFTALSFLEKGMEYYRTNLLPNDVSGLLVSSIEISGG